MKIRTTQEIKEKFKKILTRAFNNGWPVLTEWRDIQSKVNHMMWHVFEEDLPNMYMLNTASLYTIIFNHDFNKAYYKHELPAITTYWEVAIKNVVMLETPEEQIDYIYDFIEFHGLQS